MPHSLVPVSLLHFSLVAAFLLPKEGLSACILVFSCTVAFAYLVSSLWTLYHTRGGRASCVFPSIMAIKADSVGKNGQWDGDIA
jgi:hypothetical protein